jgi:hypothetical protein
MIPRVGNREKPFFRKILYYLLDNSKKGICQFFLSFAGEKNFLICRGRGLFFSAFLKTILVPFGPGVFRGACEKRFLRQKNQGGKWKPGLNFSKGGNYLWNCFAIHDDMNLIAFIIPGFTRNLVFLRFPLGRE